MDKECSLGIVHFDLASVGKFMQISKEESEDEINIDDIDMEGVEEIIDDEDNK